MGIIPWYYYCYGGVKLLTEKKKTLMERLQSKKQKMQEQIQRGRERTEQDLAEKLRKKKQQAKFYEPGTIKYGLFHRQGIGDFMKDALERRRNKRKEK